MLMFQHTVEVWTNNKTMNISGARRNAGKMQFMVSRSKETVLYIYLYVKLQLGFNPVAVVQQYNRQVTHFTQTQYKNTTINDTTTANTYTILPATTNTTNRTKKKIY
jgi:hypothetical protein